MEHQPTPDLLIQDAAAYTTAILDRLIEQYLARTVVPSPDGAPLTIARFHRLYQWVLAEGYGR